jgi:mannose-6-phosphate isomerase-like protein (cupin superfamily)
MDAFEMAELVAWREQTGELYHEFLRRPSMSLGLYVLDAGAEDPQSPHDEDEVYYVVAGRAAITVAGARRDVAAGSVVFVSAGAEHRFHDITERLELLVVFAPAESG